MGRIGQAIGRRLAGFGCPLLYTGRSGPKAEVEAALGASFLPLDALLPRCDFVVVVCALTADTRTLIDGRRLGLMKPDGVLVNVSRGEVVDQDALIQWLRDNPGARAGLDVTSPEPLPLDSPLFSLPNALVLPHIGSATQACREEMARVAAANCAAGLDGAPMVYEVPETAGLAAV
jgi:phosphoglycerate dehydrogenase-like enzyme